MSNKSKWTVLTYIAAHNNLAAFGKQSLLEILGVGSTPDVVHGVLYDGALPGRHTGAAARYIMDTPGRVGYQEQLGAFDSGDPDALIATANWLFERNPAEHYGLVLWSHGSGWEPAEIAQITVQARPGAQADPAESRERASAPGARALFRTTLRAILTAERAAERAVLFDDGTGHALDTIELARVVDAIAGSVGQPLELLGMDACLMANVEVAYQIRSAVRYLVASEELVPGHSWPYREVYGALLADPDQRGADFARLIVDRYVRFYTERPPAGGDVTKVALDLGQLGELGKGALATLAQALCREMNTAAPVLWKVQRDVLQHETQGERRQPNKFNYALWDIGSLAAGLAASTEVSEQVRQAARAAVAALLPGAGSVLSEAHRGHWFDGICGTSVYLMPPGKQRISPSYPALAFAKESQWGEMLSAYHQHFD